MDIMQISLITLVIVSTICIIVLTVFLVKLLISAKDFMCGLNMAVNTVNKGLEPAVTDLKETFAGINSLVKTADNRVKVMNCALNGILGATGVLGGKVKGVLSGLIEYFKAGLSLFKK